MTCWVRTRVHLSHLAAADAGRLHEKQAEYNPYIVVFSQFPENRDLSFAEQSLCLTATDLTPCSHLILF